MIILQIKLNTPFIRREIFYVLLTVPSVSHYTIHIMTYNSRPVWLQIP